MGQRLEMFSFFHSMKSLKSASDLQLNQSHHYEIRVGFLGGGEGEVAAWRCGRTIRMY